MKEFNGFVITEDGNIPFNIVSSDVCETDKGIYRFYDNIKLPSGTSSEAVAYLPVGVTVILKIVNLNVDKTQTNTEVNVKSGAKVNHNVKIFLKNFK